MFDLFIASVLQQATSELNVPPEAKRYIDAVTRLLGTAITQWRVVAASGARCTQCGDPAISGCLKCGCMSCLRHSFVSPHTGQVACSRCLGVTMNSDARRPGNGADQAAASAAVEELRKKHLKTLKLEPDATDDDVHAAFRELGKKHHPDRAPRGKRVEAEKAFKRITEAYHWLKAHPRNGGTS